MKFALSLAGSSGIFAFLMGLFPSYRSWRVPGNAYYNASPDPTLLVVLGLLSALVAFIFMFGTWNHSRSLYRLPYTMLLSGLVGLLIAAMNYQPWADDMGWIVGGSLAAALLFVPYCMIESSAEKSPRPFLFPFIKAVVFVALMLIAHAGHFLLTLPAYSRLTNALNRLNGEVWHRIDWAEHLVACGSTLMIESAVFYARLARRAIKVLDVRTAAIRAALKRYLVIATRASTGPHALALNRSII